MAGLQAPSLDLIEHDSRHHPLPWVASAVGVALLIAALIAWTCQRDLIGALLGVSGCVVLSISTALLQVDLSPRRFAVLSLSLSLIVIAGGLIATTTITSAAWVTVGSGLILLSTSGFKLVRIRRQRQP